MFQTHRPKAFAPNVRVPACGFIATTKGSFRIYPGKTKKPQFILAFGSFFCDNQTCSRKIFAEHFGNWVSRYARRTKRLNEFLVELAALGGGEGSARLAKKMGYQWSPDTLLREMMAAEIPNAHRSDVIGVDDFAFRKGHTYGTIIVDLQRHCVIDLLPDRRKETLQEWLEKRPQIRVVSRDRAPSYAKAVSIGAPQAFQVADRWHLMKNLGEAVERFLNTKTNLIRQAHDRLLEDDIEPIPDLQEPDPDQAEKTEVLGKALSVSEQNRKEKCDRVRALYEQGTGLRAIARQLGISRRSVRKYIYEDAPHLFRKRRSCSEVEPFHPFLFEQWDSGIHNAAQLWREIRGKGFQGSQSNLRRYLASWRMAKSKAVHHSSARSLKRSEFPRPSSWRVSRLMTQIGSKTDKSETGFLQHLYELWPSAKVAAKLGRQFLALLRERRKDLFNQWLTQVDKSGIDCIKNFAYGLKQDRAAVEGAMCSNWSNGQTEGQVNRLKLVKRQMFGRANFELLKKRILLTTNR